LQRVTKMLVFCFQERESRKIEEETNPAGQHVFSTSKQMITFARRQNAQCVSHTWEVY